MEVVLQVAAATANIETEIKKVCFHMHAVAVMQRGDDALCHKGTTKNCYPKSFEVERGVAERSCQVFCSR